QGKASEDPRPLRPLDLRRQPEGPQVPSDGRQTRRDRRAQDGRGALESRRRAEARLVRLHPLRRGDLHRAGAHASGRTFRRPVIPSFWSLSMRHLLPLLVVCLLLSSISVSPGAAPAPPAPPPPEALPARLAKTIKLDVIEDP